MTQPGGGPPSGGAAFGDRSKGYALLLQATTTNAQAMHHTVTAPLRA